LSVFGKKLTVYLGGNNKKLINIAMKVKKKHGKVIKMSLMLFTGTPDNGVQFHVVHAEKVRHQVWLIRTATNSSTESALHEEEPYIKK